MFWWHFSVDEKNHLHDLIIMSLYCRLSQFDTDTRNIHHCLEWTFLEQELIYISCYSDKAIGWTTRESEFRFHVGKRDFVLPYNVWTGCAAHWASHAKDVGGSFSPGVKQLVSEADYPHSSTVKMKNVWSCTFTPYLNKDLCVISRGRISH